MFIELTNKNGGTELINVNNIGSVKANTNGPEFRNGCLTVVKPIHVQSFTRDWNDYFYYYKEPYHEVVSKIKECYKPATKIEVKKNKVVEVAAQTEEDK